MYENLDVWKRSARLSADLYKYFAGLKDYGFRDQVTRAGLSIPSNIAEGFERDSEKEKAEKKTTSCERLAARGWKLISCWGSFLTPTYVEARMMKRRFFQVILFLLAGFLAWPQAAPAAIGNIDATDKYAWSENGGWINSHPSNGGVGAYTDHLTGYAWAENIGWIKLGVDAGGPYTNSNATDWGVNHDGLGNLSGYAWSENAGWINFNPSDSQVTVDLTTGDFDGYAWAENTGWIHFKNASPAYGARVQDFDGDGTSDLGDSDDDNDGAPDTSEVTNGTDPLDANDWPQLFSDVTNTHAAYTSSLVLSDAGIVTGCGGGNFCPEMIATRDLAAIWLIKAAEGGAYTPPGATGSVYTDIGAADFNADWIEDLSIHQITTGCGGGNYCPDQALTKDQAAQMLLKALYGIGYAPGAATGLVYGDVGAADFAADWIEDMANKSFAEGCSGGNYCPEDGLTLAGFAKMLAKTFGLAP